MKTVLVSAGPKPRWILYNGLLFNMTHYLFRISLTKTHISQSPHVINVMTQSKMKWKNP